MRWAIWRQQVGGTAFGLGSSAIFRLTGGALLRFATRPGLQLATGPVQAILGTQYAAIPVKRAELAVLQAGGEKIQTGTCVVARPHVEVEYTSVGQRVYARKDVSSG